MNFLILADLQGADGHERCFKDPTYPLQRWRVETTLDLLQKLYKEHDCKGLIDLGDTTDDRQAIPISTINSVLSRLAFFKGGHNIKLMGNHEQLLKSPEIHSGAMYSSVFNVVGHSSIFDFEDCPVYFACVSYIDDQTQLEVAINDIIRVAKSLGKKKIVFLGHFSISGCLAHGITLKDGIDSNTLSSVSLGLFGHIHKHQQVGPRLFYVGSPFQQDFGESQETKYVGVLDTNTLEVKWIDTHLPKYLRYNLTQFEQRLDPTSEDRIEVLLQSHDEAQHFYSHPLCSRATPTYAYSDSSQVEASATEDSKALDLLNSNALLSAYVSSYPPETKGLSVDVVDLLECGKTLLQND